MTSEPYDLFNALQDGNQIFELKMFCSKGLSMKFIFHALVLFSSSQIFCPGWTESKKKNTIKFKQKSIYDVIHPLSKAFLLKTAPN